MLGILLYGPPASGKDTISRALHDLDGRYVLFPRLKVGPGRTEGYRASSQEDIDELAASGEVLWQNQRYGATYVVDRPALLQHLREHVSVVHLGQTAAVPAIRSAFPDAAWLSVELQCTRDVALKRLIARGASDARERLAAWEQTERLANADLVIDTVQVAALDAAQQIDRTARSLRLSGR